MKQFWMIGANMGYGHHRAIYPLRDIAIGGKIVDIGTDAFVDEDEQKQWKRFLVSYELLSRATAIPVIGKWFKYVLNRLLVIPKRYPYRDSSEATFQVRYLKRKIKGGLCQSVIKLPAIKNVPIVTSFYAPAIVADYHGVQNVYCIITDTDLNRVWVAEHANESNIRYFASERRAVLRLKSYGVKEENIILTGFPLPKELLGNRDLDVLRKDLTERLFYLDPQGRFSYLHQRNVDHFIGTDFVNRINKNRKLTITFVVGGAGAQKEIAASILRSMKQYIVNDEVAINLIAGIRTEVNDYFLKIVNDIIDTSPNIKIVFDRNLHSYFDKMNEVLHTTDILWTKPSELSFYCALGIPILFTKPIGPQEKSNKKWLTDIHAGIKQLDPEHCGEWLMAKVRNGSFAEAAWNGFLKARKYGTYKIEDYLMTGELIQDQNPLRN